VLYTNGTITGTSRRTFDEIYTATAIEGLDTNGDGKYDRKELSELAKVNIDGLKEFDYFTFAKLGDTPLKFKPPVDDYWLSYTDKGILTLHFTLPLEQPLSADATGFNFAIYDASFFIAFDLAANDPVKLGAGAPAGCKAAIHEPDDTDDIQRLNDAFSNALEAPAADGGGQPRGGARPAATRAAEPAPVSPVGKTVAINAPSREALGALVIRPAVNDDPRGSLPSPAGELSCAACRAPASSSSPRRSFVLIARAPRDARGTSVETLRRPG
jgi:ABC-type uncharacterized transport system substrate-binding protein